MRIARWVGLVGAVVYTVGFFLVSSVPGGGDVDASDFEDFYVTDDNTSLPVIGLFVLTIGALALLWFFHPDLPESNWNARRKLWMGCSSAGTCRGPRGCQPLGRPVSRAGLQR